MWPHCGEADLGRADLTIAGPCRKCFIACGTTRKNPFFLPLDVCNLPKIAGPCEGYYPTWYFDAERGQCGQFIYGGCLGNANRFKTREECNSQCVPELLGKQAI